MSIDFNRYKTRDFSNDCTEFNSISVELINFDEIRKRLWSQLKSVDAYDESKKTLIEIIDISYYRHSNSIEELFTEMRQKIFESLILLLNEHQLKIDFNNKTKPYFKFKLVFCKGRKEDIKAYEYLRIRLDNILRPFGCALIGFKL